MEFRSFDDLTAIVRSNCHKLPDDIELIVGVPRSGMLPASMIALLTDLPLLDLESFLRGALPTKGTTREIAPMPDADALRRVLIVEDSISSGRSLEEVRRRLSERFPTLEPVTLAVIAAPHTRDQVDIHFDICTHPRAFEWNFLNSWVCAEGAFDLDGVFCEDPTDLQNDDGEGYRGFVETAGVLRRPGQRLHRIVTSRLEKYRPATEDWLKRAGIRYDRLDMLGGVTATERREQRLHAPFKAKHYAADPAARIFVESDSGQAREIARISGKPVLDVETMSLISPAGLSVPYARRQAESLTARAGSKVRRLAARIVRPSR